MTCLIFDLVSKRLYQSVKGPEIISANLNSWMGDYLGGFELTTVDDFFVMVVDNSQRNGTCKWFHDISYYTSNNKRVRCSTHDFYFRCFSFLTFLIQTMDMASLYICFCVSFFNCCNIIRFWLSSFHLFSQDKQTRNHREITVNQKLHLIGSYVFLQYLSVIKFWSSLRINSSNISFLVYMFERKIK